MRLPEYEIEKASDMARGLYLNWEKSECDG